MARILCMLLFGILVLYGCHLQEIEFFNFQQRLMVSPAPGSLLRYGIIQNDADEYLIAGSNADSQLLISRVEASGGLVYHLAAGSGSGHDIIRTKNATEEYLLLGNEGNDCFVALMDKNGIIQGNRRYLKNEVNGVLGLVDFVQGYSIAAKPDSGYVITGHVKQTIGGSRMCHISLDNILRLNAVRTSISGFYGTRIIMEPDGKFVVAGIAAANVFVARFDSNMNLIRHRVLPNSNARYFAGISRNSDNEYLLPFSTADSNDSITIAIFSNDLSARQEIILPVRVGLEKAEVFNVSSTRDSGFLLLGYVRSPGENNEVFIMKINQSAERQWVETFPGDIATYPLELLQAKDFGYTALCLIGDGTGYNYLLLKTDERGKTR